MAERPMDGDLCGVSFSLLSMSTVVLCAVPCGGHENNGGASLDVVAVRHQRATAQQRLSFMSSLDIAEGSGSSKLASSSDPPTCKRSVKQARSTGSPTSPSVVSPVSPRGAPPNVRSRPNVDKAPLLSAQGGSSMRSASPRTVPVLTTSSRTRPQQFPELGPMPPTSPTTTASRLRKVNAD